MGAPGKTTSNALTTKEIFVELMKRFDTEAQLERERLQLYERLAKQEADRSTALLAAMEGANSRQEAMINGLIAARTKSDKALMKLLWIAIAGVLALAGIKVAELTGALP